MNDAKIKGAVNPVRLLAVLFGVISIIAVSACSLQPADCAREDVFCVGLVTAFDGVDDHGLNQSAWETLQSMEAPAQIARLDVIESVDTRDWRKNIIFFAEGGYDVIVTVGREIDKDMVTVAAQYPQTLFIGLDQELEEEYPNVATIYFPKEQAGFLAGMLAAMTTEADKVGAVCEASGIEAVWRYCEGFRTGAVYDRNDVSVSVIYRDNESSSNAFNDPDWGEGRALSLIDNGVDVLSGFGGRTLEGALLAASRKGVLVIGTDEDLYYALPDVQPVLVTSFINDPNVQLSQIVMLAHQGKMSNGPHTGQVALTPFRMPRYETATEIQSAMDIAVQMIRQGEIEIEIPEQK